MPHWSEDSKATAKNSSKDDVQQLSLHFIRYAVSSSIFAVNYFKRWGNHRKYQRKSISPRIKLPSRRERSDENWSEEEKKSCRISPAEKTHRLHWRSWGKVDLNRIEVYSTDAYFTSIHGQHMHMRTMVKPEEFIMAIKICGSQEIMLVFHLSPQWWKVRWEGWRWRQNHKLQHLSFSDIAGLMMKRRKLHIGWQLHWQI